MYIFYLFCSENITLWLETIYNIRDGAESFVTVQQICTIPAQVNQEDAISLPWQSKYPDYRD